MMRSRYQTRPGPWCAAATLAAVLWLTASTATAQQPEQPAEWEQGVSLQVQEQAKVY